MNAITRNIFENNRHCVLGTVTPDRAPWVTPVRLAYDETAVYWMSKSDTTHSQNIMQDNQVSIVVFDSHQTNEDNEAKGAVYMVTNGRELTGDEAANAREFYCMRHPDRGHERFSTWHMYSAPIGEINETKTHNRMIHYSYSGESA